MKMNESKPSYEVIATSPKKMKWQEAMDWAESLGCRLENMDELQEAHKTKDVDDDKSYWSSTSYDTSTTFAWYVYFNDGDVSNSHKSDTYYARCVRQGRREGY